MISLDIVLHRMGRCCKMRPLAIHAIVSIIDTSVPSFSKRNEDVPIFAGRKVDSSDRMQRSCSCWNPGLDGRVYRRMMP